MEGKISMATKRRATMRFSDEYMKASKKDRGRILDEICSVLKIGRSTARRRLAEAGRKPRGLLVRVWLMMDLPCAKYLKEMLPLWLPMLRACGELAEYDGFAFNELMVMSPATMDRYLRKSRDAARPEGLAGTRPAGELLCNSIAIRKAGDELDGLSGNVEADTVAHCGPSLRGEFCRTLTVVDIATGWTANASCRNNAFANFSRAQALVESRLPFRQINIEAKQRMLEDFG